MNPIKTLNQYGQSVWLDDIRRGILHNGELQRLIEEDGVSGLTSNPAIFRQAIADSEDYTPAITALAQQRTLDAETIYERLAVEDLRRAADLLLPVYRKTQGNDGHVSLEVSPRLAGDTQGTLAAARRLWGKVDRPNLMIKVPGTPEGLPAVEELIAEGINVNVTLLFSLAAYEQVVEHYLRGLERRRISGQDLSHCVSVASFFLSRIDTAVDGLLDRRFAPEPTPRQQAQLIRMRGRTALASARLAYQRWQSLFSGDRWESLAAAGARPQRLLWASTGTKNPEYSDLLYVESLVLPSTVTTLPPATLEALRDHGRPCPTQHNPPGNAGEKIQLLQHLDIDLEQVTDRLLEEGLAKFDRAYDDLLEAVESARRQALSAPFNRQVPQLPLEMMEQVEDLVQTFRPGSGEAVHPGLDWLKLVPEQLARLAELRRIVHLTEGRYFRHALLLGMGGHSLTAKVLSRMFGHGAEHPELLALDSTDPDEISTIEQRIDPQHSLFIIAGKAGNSPETELLGEYFFDRLCERIGQDSARRHFFAITDPGSPLETFAEARGFRKVFRSRPGIGGAFSAFSDFGMVPAALLGIDLSRFLESANGMVRICGGTDSAENPAVMLGAVLATARAQGRDKVTFVASHPVEPLTLWLEELLAETTGKDRTGLIPIQGEPLSAHSAYDQDRLFVYLRLTEAADPEQDAGVDRLKEAGHPVVRIEIDDPYNLGQEFVRWEMACAVAGSIMGVDPFSRPDVEAAKQTARELLSDYERGIGLPAQTPLARAGHLSLYAEPHYAAELQSSNRSVSSLEELLGAHLYRLDPGDYFALLPYLDPGDAVCAELLQAVRLRIRDHYHVASCLNYGPGYLYSTGQVYKGGPNTGLFLILTKDPDQDIHIPSHRISFGGVETAEALAEQQVMALRGRRLVRLHLGRNPAAALRQLLQMLNAAFSYAAPPKRFWHGERNAEVA